jgi:hypothetical protein
MKNKVLIIAGCIAAFVFGYVLAGCSAKHANLGKKEEDEDEDNTIFDQEIADDFEKTENKAWEKYTSEQESQESNEQPKGTGEIQ